MRDTPVLDERPSRTKHQCFAGQFDMSSMSKRELTFELRSDSSALVLSSINVIRAVARGGRMQGESDIKKDNPERCHMQCESDIMQL